MLKIIGLKRPLLITALILISLLFLPSAFAAGSSAISQVVVDDLATGDFNLAIATMRNEKLTPKLRYLMHSALRIANFKAHGIRNKKDANKIHRSVAVSYHNLYLFLKGRGIEQRKFFKEAKKYYGKARRKGTYLYKDECNLLEAALWAASGDLKKAEKKFRKVDEAMLGGDFESMEYLAAYFAASGDVEETLPALQEVYDINPDRTLKWLAVSDDFHSIEKDPRFRAFIKSLRNRPTEDDIILTIPKPKKPSLSVTDSSGLFVTVRDLPRYEKRRRSRGR